jgi:hypothetical protein
MAQTLLHRSSSAHSGQEISMTLMDKVVAAVTPTESEEKRQQARAQAQAAAGLNDWLSLVLQQHQQIESCFDAVRSSGHPAARLAAQKELMTLFTGHSNAEESVLYPALARCGEKADAGMSFTEQAAAKIQLGELEYLDPMSQEYLDKLEHLRGAIAHHMYEEEGSRFLELKEKVSAVDQDRLTQRFKEEFDRYVGADVPSTGATPPGSDRVGTTAPRQPYSA